MKQILTGALILALTPLMGCSTMKITAFEDKTPKFILEEYFECKTEASGIF